MSSSESTSDPSERSEKSQEMRPWKAPSLQKEHVDLERLTYVVADEIVDDTIGLS